MGQTAFRISAGCWPRTSESDSRDWYNNFANGQSVVESTRSCGNGYRKSRSNQSATVHWCKYFLLVPPAGRVRVMSVSLLVSSPNCFLFWLVCLSVCFSQTCVLTSISLMWKCFLLIHLVGRVDFLFVSALVPVTSALFLVFFFSSSNMCVDKYLT